MSILRASRTRLVYGVALAQVAGRATLRLAYAPRLPFEFTGLADNVNLYLGEVEKLAEDMRRQTIAENARISSGVYELALDPTLSIRAPLPKSEVPYFNFAPLRNAMAALEKAAAAYSTVANSGTPATVQDNALLYTSERALIDVDGLPGRPWFTHHIYAPGFYTGYGVKTLPGVREAIEERQYELVEEEVNAAATVLNRLAVQVRELTPFILTPFIIGCILCGQFITSEVLCALF